MPGNSSEREPAQGEGRERSVSGACSQLHEFQGRGEGRDLPGPGGRCSMSALAVSEQVHLELSLHHQEGPHTTHSWLQHRYATIPQVTCIPPSLAHASPKSALLEPDPSLMIPHCDPRAAPPPLWIDSTPFWPPSGLSGAPPVAPSYLPLSGMTSSPEP